MKKLLKKTFWTVFILPPLLALLMMLSPLALADGMDTGTDAIELAQDGTLTLISDHMAGEGVCSVKLQLLVEDGSAGFVFSGALGDRLTYCTAGDGTLDIYISGAVPLMAEGQTSLVLGTVTGSVENVSPLQQSLQYVYGRRMIALNVPEPEDEADAGYTGAKAALDAKITEIAGYIVTDHRYTEESWQKLNEAFNYARAVLEREDASDEDVNEALKELEDAFNGLQLTSAGRLELALENAAALDGSRYTPESYAALQAAVEAGANALAGGQNEQMDSAAEAIERAMKELVELVQADGSGGIHSDPYDPGTGSGKGRSAAPPADGTPLPQESGAPEAQTSDGAAAPDSAAAPASSAAPTAVAGGTAPHTGDETPLALWATLLCLCAGALTPLLFRRARSRR